MKNNFVLQSSVIHFSFILLMYLTAIISFNQPEVVSKVEFRVIDVPQKIKKSNVTPLKSAPLAPPKKVEKKQPKKEVKKGTRKVFGVRKRSIKVDSPTAVKTKTGNILAKEVDEKKLKKGDEESLPIPEEEYLVTAMPRVKSEFRGKYPEQAKNEGIEGKVILEILIDGNGNVRKATLIDGPGYGLNEAALEWIKKFKFEPAYIGDREVAVVVQYGINFVLEN